MNSQYLDGGKDDKDVRRNKSNNEYVHDIWDIIRIFKCRSATRITIPYECYYTQLFFVYFEINLKQQIMSYDYYPKPLGSGA